MPRTRILGIALLGLVLTAGSAGHVTAQPYPIKIAAGPQVGTLGIGVGASVRLLRLVGASAEYHIMPAIPSWDKTGFGTTLDVNPSVSGGLIMATFHPTGGSFALGAGLMFGGPSFDVEMALDPTSTGDVEIGNNVYSASDLDTILGDFSWGGTAPVVAIGFMGTGINVALGAIIAEPVYGISVTGRLKDDPGLQADIDREIQAIENEINDTVQDISTSLPEWPIPIYPYLRLGFRFGF